MSYLFLITLIPSYFRTSKLSFVLHLTFWSCGKWKVSSFFFKKNKLAVLDPPCKEAVCFDRRNKCIIVCGTFLCTAGWRLIARAVCAVSSWWGKIWFTLLRYMICVRKRCQSLTVSVTTLLSFKKRLGRLLTNFGSINWKLLLKTTTYVSFVCRC